MTSTGYGDIHADNKFEMGENYFLFQGVHSIINNFNPQTYKRRGGGEAGGRLRVDAIPHRYFFKFYQEDVLSGHLSISVAVHLSLRHIYCEFGENRHIHIRDIK